MNKIPVIIDCDPGVDDSYAIALANAHPEFEIVALTAVEGNVPAVLTRRNCLGLREIFGLKDTKVAYGAELPLVKPYFRHVSITHGEGGIGGIEVPEATIAPEEEPAWEVIYEEAVKHKGNLLLFAIGPLTNIALALRHHPDLPEYLGKTVIMGGGTFGNVEVTGSKAEFNIWIDPTAAKEVFENLEVYMVGLNATHSAPLDAEDFDELLEITGRGSNRQSEFLHKLTAFSKKNSLIGGEDNNIIHDALAVAAVTTPDTVSFAKYYVRVEDEREENLGETVIDFEGLSGIAPNCHVAMEVDREKFITTLKNMCHFYREEADYD